MHDKLSQNEAKLTSMFNSISAAVEQICAFQRYFLGEYFDFRSLLYYAGAAVVLLMFTSFESTFRARTPLLLALFLCSTIERVLLYPMLLLLVESDMLLVSQVVSSFRWASFSAMIIYLICKRASYQDYEKLNSQRL